VVCCKLGTAWQSTELVTAAAACCSHSFCYECRSQHQKTALLQQQPQKQPFHNLSAQLCAALVMHNSVPSPVAECCVLYRTVLLLQNQRQGPAARCQSRLLMVISLLSGWVVAAFAGPPGSC
jgi:hypothetical protein